jgi:DNA polymerase-1
MKKKLLAIDGNSILNRAFYGVRPLSTKDGFPTNALYGMVNMIMRQAEAIAPDYCAVAFDLKAKTFRHKMFDSYKAGRRPMPEELAQQVREVTPERIFRAMQTVKLDTVYFLQGKEAAE